MAARVEAAGEGGATAAAGGEGEATARFDAEVLLEGVRRPAAGAEATAHKRKSERRVRPHHAESASVDRFHVTHDGPFTYRFLLD